MSKRDDIQTALLNRLKQQIPSLRLATRYYVDLTKVSAEQQPAIAVVTLASRAARQPAMPAKWTQYAQVVLYVRTTNEAAATPETQLFSLIEQAEIAHQRQPDESVMSDDFGTTLGGAVWSCHIVDLHIHHGIGEGQAAASLTVEMVTLS